MSDINSIMQRVRYNLALRKGKNGVSKTCYPAFDEIITGPVLIDVGADNDPPIPECHADDILAQTK